MTLADIYIEPRFKVHEYCLSLKYLETIKREEKYYTESFYKIAQDNIHDFVYDLINGEKTYGELRDSKCNLYFILGYPGQGKSSFCKKMLNDIIGFNKVVSKDVIFLKIRNMTDTQSLVNDPIQTIYEEWVKEYSLNVEDFPLKSIQNSLVILDGLDELFIQENLTSSIIDEFCKSIIRKTESFSKMKVLITSRYGYINIDNLKKTNSLIIQLDEFTESQEIDWLEKYRVFHSESKLTASKIKLYNANESYSAIKELITQPILLHLIATVNQEIEQSTNRSTIYDQLFTELINRSWAKEGQIDILINLEKEDLREFIRDIAYTIYLSGKQYIHKSKLVELPQTKIFIDRLGDQNNVRDVLKNIMIAFYFQETKKNLEEKTDIDRSDYAIEFLHKSLQEYLVAEKIWEEFQYLITKESRRNRYFLESAGDAIRYIDAFLPENGLSFEISNNLREIIGNSSNDVNVELANRIDLFLPEWIQYGFVYESEWGQKHYLTKSRNNLNIIFLVLTNLVHGRNYFFNRNFTPLLSRHDLSVSLKDQIFVGKIKDAFERDIDEELELSLFDATIYLNNNDYGAMQSKTEFKSLIMENVDFVSFDNSSMKVINCIINSSSFSIHAPNTSNNFEKCNFSQTLFRYGVVNFSKCVFNNCTFMAYSFFEFDECKFDKCVFHVLEDYDKNSYLDNDLQNCVFFVSRKDGNSTSSAFIY